MIDKMLKGFIDWEKRAMSAEEEATSLRAQLVTVKQERDDLREELMEYFGAPVSRKLKEQLATVTQERDEFDRRLSKELEFGLSAQGEINSLREQLAAAQADAESSRTNWQLSCKMSESKLANAMNALTVFLDNHEERDSDGLVEQVVSLDSYNEARKFAIDAARRGKGGE